MMPFELAPALPISLIMLVGILAVVATVLRAAATPMGSLFRLLTILMLIVFLLGPLTTNRTYQALPDQAFIVVDESASMRLGDRAKLSKAAEDGLAAALDEQGLETITARFGDGTSSDLESGLAQALAAAERDQISSVFIVSDGQVTGETVKLVQGLSAPVHGLLIGDEESERDRRVSFVSAPRFGLVGDDPNFRFVVEDEAIDVPVVATVRVDGEIRASITVLPSQEVDLALEMKRPGERIVEVSVPSAGEELTLRNNAATTAINVIRDRLRVLLISGEPHAGERVWRNVLKSDPAVDLVHFTILKPGDKAVSARRDELNLIEFPSRELFLEKLEHFNVVIFDRYTYRRVISSFELAEVARYVENGGAVLIAAGPELATGGSLAAQPNLSYILPALPSGFAQDKPFVPKLTDRGTRHPITASLGSQEDWGRWLRNIPAEVRSGDVLLEADESAPLLVTNRVGEGRIAMLLSDHLWLWARGFDGGGPHREFLRRLVHWLMAEPELEEEALLAELSDDGVLQVRRRSLSETVAPVTATAGETPLDLLTLEPASDGLFTAERTDIGADTIRLETTTEDGRLLTTAAIRQRNASAEYAAVTVTPEKLAPLLDATGGGFQRIDTERSAAFSLRPVRAGRGDQSGRGWLGYVPQRASATLSERREPLAPRWIYALGASLFLFLGWLSESGRFKTSFAAGKSQKTSAV